MNWCKKCGQTDSHCAEYGCFDGTICERSYRIGQEELVKKLCETDEFRYCCANEHIINAIDEVDKTFLDGMENWLKELKNK